MCVLVMLCVCGKLVKEKDLLNFSEVDNNFNNLQSCFLEVSIPSLDYCISKIWFWMIDILYLCKYF